MAKAREIPGLSTDLAYGEVAARVLEVRCQELVDHSENVLDTNDIERVHSMRVATRRLRAAIEIFRPCFPKGEGGRALKEIKALADALGERRDRDVAIDALESFAAAMPAPDRPGIRSLADRFREEQRIANEELAPFVDPARLEAIEDAVRSLAAAARARAGEETAETDEDEAAVEAHAEAAENGEPA
jgi:CHAD domain-containing protein